MDYNVFVFVEFIVEDILSNIESVEIIKNNEGIIDNGNIEIGEIESGMFVLLDILEIFELVNEFIVLEIIIYFVIDLCVFDFGVVFVSIGIKAFIALIFGEYMFVKFVVVVFEIVNGEVNIIIIDIVVFGMVGVDF